MPDNGVATSSRRQYCFVLQVRSWTKHGKFINEGRNFVFSLETEGEREEWMYLLQFAVEGHRHGAKGTAAAGQGASGAVQPAPKAGFSRRPSEASMSYVGTSVPSRKTSDDMAESAPPKSKRRSEV